jgi:hypothetical protein
MMYPWKNNNGKKRQPTKQLQTSQRGATTPVLQAPGGGYIPMLSPAPSSIAHDATSAGEATSINSQNPNDSIMDSVFNSCLFSDDEVTVTRDGGYLYGGSSGRDDEDHVDEEDNIDVSSNVQAEERGRALAIRESMPDTCDEEQGFELQKGRTRRRSSSFNKNSSRVRSSSTTPNINNHAKSSTPTTGLSSSAGSTAFSSVGNDNDADDDYVDDFTTSHDASYTSGNNNNNILGQQRASLQSQQSRNRAAPGFFATLLAEFVYFYRHDSWYSVRDTVTGRRLDIAASFAPQPTPLVLTVKLTSTMLVLGTIAYSLWDFYLLRDNNAAQDLVFWLSYFTNWSLTMAAVYQLFSFANTLCFSSGLSRRAYALPQVERVTGRVQWTWIFFTLALHAQVLAACMFWIAWFQPSHYKHVAMTTGNATSSSSSSSFLEDAAATATSLGFYYLTLVPHSLTVIAVAVDGLVVNRIPLRLMHWWGWVLGFDLLYVAWTMIRSLVLMDGDAASSIPLTEYGYLYSKYMDMNVNSTSILESLNEGNDNATTETNFNLDNYTLGVDSIKNNGMDSGGSATISSTAVYTSNWLNWQDDWPLATIQALILCLVVSPILYILLWTLSLYTCPCVCSQDRRRYVKTTNPNSPPHLSISIREIGGGGPPLSSSSSQHDRDHGDHERQQKPTKQQQSSLFGISFW